MDDGGNVLALDLGLLLVCLVGCFCLIHPINHPPDQIRAKREDSRTTTRCTATPQPHPGKPRQNYEAAVQRVVSILQVPTLISTGHLLPGGINRIFPTRQLCDLAKNILTYELDDRFSQVTLAGLDGSRSP